MTRSKNSRKGKAERWKHVEERIPRIVSESPLLVLGVAHGINVSCAKHRRMPGEPCYPNGWLCCGERERKNRRRMIKIIDKFCDEKPARQSPAKEDEER